MDQVAAIVNVVVVVVAAAAKYLNIHKFAVHIYTHTHYEMRETKIISQKFTFFFISIK
jgi:hypothetical protein